MNYYLSFININICETKTLFNYKINFLEER